MELLGARTPDPEEIRAQVARGRRVVMALGEEVGLPEAMAAASDLRLALPDMHVFASPGTKDRGPALTVLALIAEGEAEATRASLASLVTEFRQLAKALVANLHAGDADDPETIECQGLMWTVDPHGEHCRFENLATGEVVEANVYRPAAIDPYFLLLFAETSGRHGEVVAVCLEGFHDMCRLLELAGVTDA